MKTFRGWPAVGCLGGLLLIVSFAGCRTGHPKLPPEAGETAAPIEEFLPATFVANVRAGEGRYPDLYAPESFAIWAGTDVAALRRAKAIQEGTSVDPLLESLFTRIDENFLVIECHVASVFADSSIAYDVVGFRGVSVYLTSPDGRRIDPIQTLVGASAPMASQGALKKFQRANLAIFQKRDIWLDEPTAPSDANAMRLVLDAYDTKFHFEWVAATPHPEPWKPSEDETLKVLKTGFMEFYGRLTELGQIVQ